MDPLLKSSLLWGLVGALAFLVLGLGGRMLAGLEISIPVLAGVAVVVFGAATVVSYLLDRRLARKRSI